MDKNTFTGLFLILLILVGSFFFLKPNANDPAFKKEQQRQHLDSLKRAGLLKPAAPKTAADTTRPAGVDSALLKSPFGAANYGSTAYTYMDNKDVHITLSNKGGRVYAVELKNFKTFTKKPLVLFSGDGNKFGLALTAGGKAINTNDLYFKSLTTAKNAADTSTTVTMRLSYSPTQFVDYTYKLNNSGYKLGLTVKLTGMEGVLANSQALQLDWTASLHQQEKDITQERQFSTVAYKNMNNDVDFLSETKDDKKQIADQKIQWVSFKQHFFSNVLIAPKGFDKVNVASTTNLDSKDVRQMNARFNLIADGNNTYPMEFYFGPNRFKTLAAQGYDLEKQINLGWGPLKLINRFAVLPVFNFLQHFGWNMGLIILVLTILLKLVLSPLTYKSYLSMAKMRVLKPEMDVIKTKVGEDNPTLLQQEYMKLYRKAGVNPLGGCLPLLLQMPIVIAFLRFFPSLFELRGESFLWMKDLSTYDNVINFGFKIPLLGDHLSLMCLLMTASTIIYTYFNNQISGATGQMKYIGYITPFMFLSYLNSYPSGLNYYYFLANMLTFAQQWLIKFLVDDNKIHARIQENKSKPEDKKKKGGFQAKLEDMMRQQQIQQAKKK